VIDSPPKALSRLDSVLDLENLTLGVISTG
jgi:hypothetical protein